MLGGASSGTIIVVNPPSDANLRIWLYKWQSILRLQDWDVKIEFARSFEMETVRRAGEVSYVCEKKTAVIKILVPQDYPTDIRWKQDIEQTVVHELLHLHFSWTDDLTGLANTGMEQAINCIALALVARDRQKDVEPG